MMNTGRGLVWTALLFLLAFLPACKISPQDVWSTAASMSTARYAATGAVIDGKLYIAGGFNGGVLDTVTAYNPRSDSWEAKTSMPTARYNAGAAVINGRLYIAGGISASNSTLNTLEVYDPVSNTWAAKSPMIEARFSPSAGSINGKLYVSGGGRSNIENPGVPLNSMEVYDPATDVWTKLSSTMPVALYDSAYGVIDGKFYVAGGWDGRNKSNVLEMYDPSTDAWSEKRNMALARQIPGFGVIDGRLYVAGGWDRATNSDLAVVESYDPVADAWTMRSSMQYARQQLVGGDLNGEFHLVGGHHNGALSTHEKLYTKWSMSMIQAWIRNKCR